MRIATYNIEWFSGLFGRDNQLLVDDNWSRRYKVTHRQQIEAIAKVLVAVDADLMLVVEAPDSGGRRSSETALEHFAKTFRLRTRRALCGYANETRQELTLLYDPDKVHARHDPIGHPTGKRGSFDAPRFDGVFRPADAHGANLKTVTFSKPPLETALETPKGRKLRLIGVHAKSKAPHGDLSQDAFIALSLENRAKQLAQCQWLRQRIDWHLDRAEPLIVLGDFNDGPGLDEYESRFGRSGIEIVLGSSMDDSRQLYDPNAIAAMSNGIASQPATARFYLSHLHRYINSLLDYVMVSPDLRPIAKNWKIWHPFDTPDCFDDEELRSALLTASDHFPVTVDMDI